MAKKIGVKSSGRKNRAIAGGGTGRSAITAKADPQGALKGLSPAASQATGALGGRTNKKGGKNLTPVRGTQPLPVNANSAVRASDRPGRKVTVPFGTPTE